MADLTFLPPASLPPELPGGRTRPSLLVDVGGIPEVARRLDLDARLLERACPFDDPQEGPRITADDLDLLLRVVDERFGGEAALVRRQAVVALGLIDADDAVRRLVDLVVTPVEHDDIRICALSALPEARVGELAEQLAEDPSPAVRAHARKLREGPTERPPVPGRVPLDQEARDGRDCGCPQQCCCG